MLKISQLKVIKNKLVMVRKEKQVSNKFLVCLVC